MQALTLDNVEVLNIPRNRVVPRRFSLDGVSFSVDAGETVLIAAGPAAGKSTLARTLLGNDPRITVASGYQIEEISSPTQDFSPKKIYIKDGFQTRDIKTIDNPGDPDATEHWEMLEKVKQAKATFIALAEIDKLKSEKVERFDRVIVIDEGRVVADNTLATFKVDLEKWIDGYARERYQYLPQDCETLRNRYGLDVKEDWLKGVQR